MATLTPITLTIEMTLPRAFGFYLCDDVDGKTAYGMEKLWGRQSQELQPIMVRSVWPNGSLSMCWAGSRDKQQGPGLTFKGQALRTRFLPQDPSS